MVEAFTTPLGSIYHWLNEGGELSGLWAGMADILNFTVFLAEVPPDLRAERQQVFAHLEMHGVEVVPRGEYSNDDALFSAAVQTDVERADLFVQLLGESPSPRVDLPALDGWKIGSRAQLQYAAALSCDIPMLRWRHPRVLVSTLTHWDRRLVEHSDVLVMELEEFKGEILNAIDDEQEDRKEGGIVLFQRGREVGALEPEFKEQGPRMPPAQAHAADAGMRDLLGKLEQQKGEIAASIQAIQETPEPTEPARPSARSPRIKDPTEAALSSIQDALNVRDAKPSSQSMSIPSAAAMLAEESEQACLGLRKGAKSKSELLLAESRSPRKLGDAVAFAVSYPSAVVRGVPFMVDPWAFRPDERDAALSRAREMLGDATSFRSGAAATVAHGSKMKVELHVDPWKVTPAHQAMIWTGTVTNASFRVTPDIDIPRGLVHALCKISIRGMLIAQIPFDLVLSEKQGEGITRTAKRLNAFASYASKDRYAVLTTVLGLEKFARVFVDVRLLESGAPYPTKLLEAIDASDVLYLFWSRNARKSRWVEKEWRYGLQKRGIQFIDPVPLVNPRRVPPPPELAAEKHFDHWTLAFMEYERSLGFWHRVRSRIMGWPP